MRKLLLDHHELLKPGRPPEERPGITEAVVMDISVSIHLHPVSTPAEYMPSAASVKTDKKCATRTVPDAPPRGLPEDALVGSTPSRRQDVQGGFGPRQLAQLQAMGVCVGHRRKTLAP